MAASAAPLSLAPDRYMELPNAYNLEARVPSGVTAA